MYFKVKQFNSKTLRLCNAKYMSRFSTVFQYFQYLSNIFQYFQSMFCTFFVLSKSWENESQKRTRFSILPAPFLWFSIVFLIEMYITKTQKNRGRISLLFESLLGKSWAHFCAAAC